MNNQRLWLSIAVFLIASCGREFSAPLPAPQIESLTPAEGYMGEAVII